MINDRIIQILYNAALLEVLDMNKAVEAADEYINRNAVVPYYIIQISLWENLDSSDLPDDYYRVELCDDEVLFLIECIESEWKNKGDIDLSMYRIQGLWNWQRYPGVMEGYHLLSEGVNPHSGGCVNIKDRAQRINDYFLLLYNRKTAQQVDSAEASTIAVPPSRPSGSPR